MRKNVEKGPIFGEISEKDCEKYDILFTKIVSLSHNLEGAGRGE